MELPKQFKKVGPAGASNGNQFEIGFSKMKSLEIRHGAWIDGIMVVDQNGKEHRAGGMGGGASTMTFQENETITRISGTYGVHIGQLTIETNLGQKETFGPGGGENGTSSFDLELNDFQVAGFFGTEDGYLVSLGVIQVDTSAFNPPSEFPSVGF